MIVFDIASVELKRMFQSPLAWIALGVVQFLMSVFFFLLLWQYLSPGAQVMNRGLTEIVVAGTLQLGGVIMLLVSPFLTMRLLSEDQRSGAIQLLFSSPLSLTELVLGKYLGIFAFLMIMLAMIALMPCSLMFGTHLDLGQLGAALLGLALLMAAFAAIGLFVSTLTRNPAVAATGTFGVLFVLWIIHVAGYAGSGPLTPVFAYLSLMRHYNSLLDGFFSSEDVIYYLLMTATFLVLSIWRLDARRTYH